MPRGYEVQRIEVKAERLRAALPRNSKLVALDERGKELCSRRKRLLSSAARTALRKA
jgi:23S rRNA pseudoU1915 N3-methylase RlmH